ncbi:MAG TPA: fatty acid--CoA ligase [Desulfomonilaceae bacterium]|nr:fatty acid--CoA ligase [Desulfomonilaceae bacterium]
MSKGFRKIAKTPSAYSYPLLVKQLLHTPMSYAPDQEIVYRDKMRYTYRDLYTRINKLASALERLGVGPGDTVAVLDWDSHRYLECFFAIPMMGAILHTVNIRLSPDQMLFTMNHAEDKVVLVHEDFIPILESIQGQLTTVEKYIVLKEGEEQPATGLPIVAEYEEMLAQASSVYDFPEFDEDTQATTFYTTGTTGDPKGVYYSHRQLVLHTLGMAVSIASYTSPGRFQSADIYMPITPMFHVHAWGVPFVATLIGAKHVYPGRYEPAMLLKLLQTEKVTFSHCVPTILHMLLASPAAKDVDLRGWKVIIGGSALPRGLAKMAMERGIEIYTGYGMSETCPLLTLATMKPEMLEWDLERQLDVRTKTGLPVPLVDLKIADVSTGNRVPQDNRTPGEILVRAPWLTQGYFKAPDKSEELWAGGWLHTGDIAVMDDKGYAQITDRLKDVIKTGGEWISSLHLESLISRHEGVSEVAVVGVPDEKWGERPLAMVVPKPDFVQKLAAEDLRKFLEQYVEDGTMSKWGIPDKFLMVEQIPKTSVGKIDKKVIKKGVKDGTL